MVILHFTGKGYGVLAGVKEYIELFEDESDISAGYESIDKGIEAHTAPGFKLERKYDTDCDYNFSSLPLERMLAPAG